MKWRTPVNGDEKTFRKFAFLPVQLDNGNTIWLEYYYSFRRYLAGTAAAPLWLTISRYQSEHLIKNENEEVSNNPSLWG